RDKTIVDLLAEYEQTHQLNLNWMRYVAPEKLIQNGLLPWVDADKTAEDFIAQIAYDHKREHAEQIVAFTRQMTDSQENFSDTLILEPLQMASFANWPLDFSEY